MPFGLFNYSTTTTNTIDMVMQKKVIVRIPDAYLRIKKTNLKIFLSITLASENEQYHI